MEKRGQVTLFVVIGIVIVLLLALILAARQTIFLPANTETLGELQQDIQDHIVTCIADVSDEPIIRIGLQGGYLNPGVDTYRLFNDTQISYLCYNMEGTQQCRNRLLLLNDMETQLDEALRADILNCVGDVQSFGRLKPITITTPQPLKVQTNILQDTISVNVNYPIIITSNKDSSVNVQQNIFRGTLEYPLGNVYRVAQDILDQETILGDFDPLFYMIAKRGEYIITKNRPYPDKLYVIHQNNHDYQFQFFIQGQPGSE